MKQLKSNSIHFKCKVSIHVCNRPISRSFFYDICSSDRTKFVFNYTFNSVFSLLWRSDNRTESAELSVPVEGLAEAIPIDAKNMEVPKNIALDT